MKESKLCQKRCVFTSLYHLVSLSALTDGVMDDVLLFQTALVLRQNWI